MDRIPGESVQLVITSPPYWQLKDYGNKHQIGFRENYESYINSLNLVWKECRRVLEKGCRLCINIGDQFARAVYYGRYKVIPIRTEIIRFCETIGFDYMGAIIWQKQTTTNTTGGASLMGSYPTPRNGILSIDYEFILLFRKEGKPPKVSPEIKKQSKLTKNEWMEYFSGHWHFGGAKQDGHIAMFPEELPKRLIKMFAFKGETVLDPFMGSGTTSLAALKLERNSIGYEINPDFIDLSKKRLGSVRAGGKKTGIVSLKDKAGPDLQKLKSCLPYQFNDPHKLELKVNPKEYPYGSKIDRDNEQQEEYFNVKEVISPELIRLNNNLTIRLIGIKEKKSVNGLAREFLIKKTKGKKIFLKYDKRKYDSDNHHLCYVYLKNKTFLNAHLLKEKLALPDTINDYKYKNKFLTL
jgi:site-specific DNA-methyltransferase (adenine-specific)